MESLPVSSGWVPWGICCCELSVNPRLASYLYVALSSSPFLLCHMGVTWGLELEEHCNTGVTLEPCTLQRKGIPGLLVESRSQQTWGAAFSRNGKRNRGLGDQGWCDCLPLANPAWKNPEMEMGQGWMRPRKHFVTKMIYSWQYVRALVGLFQCTEQAEAFAEGVQSCFRPSDFKHSIHQAHGYIQTLIPTDPQPGRSKLKGRNSLANLLESTRHVPFHPQHEAHS